MRVMAQSAWVDGAGSNGVSAVISLVSLVHHGSKCLESRVDLLSLIDLAQHSTTKE